VIDQAKDNAGRMWHSLGFHRRDGTAETERPAVRQRGHSQRAEGGTARLIGKAVVDARDEFGTDPTIVDVVLRGLDARGVQLE
jgi:CPA1 family monovalent cation:H+ antiporter